MEPRISIIGLGVKDLSIAEDFYVNKLGWSKTAASNGDIVFIQLNGILLSLYSREALAEDAKVSPQGSGFKGFSLAYNTRTEKEVDDLFEKFASQKIKIVKRPEKVFWGGYSGYICDPDENLWEIAHNPFMSFDDEGNVK